MVPDQSSPPPPPLERRTPGDTDLRVLTNELVPPGRHRFYPRRSRLRLYDRSSARWPLARVGVLALAAVLAAQRGVRRGRPRRKVRAVRPRRVQRMPREVCAGCARGQWLSSRPGFRRWSISRRTSCSVRVTRWTQSGSGSPGRWCHEARIPG